MGLRWLIKRSMTLLILKKVLKSDIEKKCPGSLYFLLLVQANFHYQIEDNDITKYVDFYNSKKIGYASDIF